MMFARAREKQARRELTRQLDSIHHRLERLESQPALELTPEKLKSALAALLDKINARFDPLERGLDAREAHAQRLDKALADQTLAIDEGIQRTERAERRVRASVARARKELKKLGYDDPGLEAEDLELRKLDGDGGRDEGLREVPATVAEHSQAPSSVRGVPLELLKRHRGFA